MAAASREDASDAAIGVFHRRATFTFDIDSFAFTIDLARCGVIYSRPRKSTRGFSPKRRDSRIFFSPSLPPPFEIFSPRRFFFSFPTLLSPSCWNLYLNSVKIWSSGNFEIWRSRVEKHARDSRVAERLVCLAFSLVCGRVRVTWDPLSRTNRDGNPRSESWREKCRVTARISGLLGARSG